MSSIQIQPTPNPNALKFILTSIVKSEDKASFKSPQDAQGLPLIKSLFEIQGVETIYLFQNVITVSKFSFEPWENLEPKIKQTIIEKLPFHDPDFELVSKVQTPSRKDLSENLQRIEAILDKKVRPGLQGDGGDLNCVQYHEEDKVLIIRYHGACGTCPSATMGTLEAIRGILREEFDEDIQVYIAPEE